MIATVSTAMSWRQLVQEQKSRILGYRIVLTVRGKKIIKIYNNQDQYKIWLETYRERQLQDGSGIDLIEHEVLYE